MSTNITMLIPIRILFWTNAANMYEYRRDHMSRACIHTCTIESRLYSYVFAALVLESMGMGMSIVILVLILMLTLILLMFILVHLAGRALQSHSESRI